MGTKTNSGRVDPSTLPYRPCVGVVLANADGQVFAGERIDTPDAWQFPQGGIDKGEAPIDAALRELKEEISVDQKHIRVVAEHPQWLTYDLPSDLVGIAFKGRFRGQRQRWFLFELLADDAVINLETAHPEFKAWRWITPGEALSAIVPFKRDIYETALSHFGQFLGEFATRN
ncbi:MAG: RNA pyrophosphohydrolase [Pseudomonadota bacterium]